MSGLARVERVEKSRSDGVGKLKNKKREGGVGRGHGFS
jgi:hypothetical protein